MREKTIYLSSVKLEATDREDRWLFFGYASVFNSKNSQGFSIAPGAFKEVLAAGAKPSMFFNHNPFDVPIGKWISLAEDERGLRVEGELSQRVTLAKDVHGALLDGTVTGMSVCICFKDEDMEFEADGTGVLKHVRELPEISLCTWPSDPKARVSEALSADEVDARIDAVKTIRDFDGFLRDAAGLSRRQAKRLTAAVKTAMAAELQRDAEDQKKAAALKRLADAFNKL